MYEKALEKLLSIITEPVQIVLLAWVGYCIRENWSIQKINSKLLKAQEERGVVLTKIVTMVESLDKMISVLFNDVRRPK